VKPSVQTLHRSHAARRGAIGSYVQLTKPRISLMVTLTGAVGYFMASRAGIDGWGLLHLMLGTLLVSGAANTLNQVLERTPDAIMQRTARRPIPLGRVGTGPAVAFASVLGLGGVLYTGLVLNFLTAMIAAITMASYAFVYTPLKRRTSLNTLIGAVPGALPPLGGWAAARGTLGLGGWVLFAIVFFWQIPHFMSIAWLLRREYAKAGFRMLPVVDPSGVRTARHMAVTAAVLVPLSLLPSALGLTGSVYLGGAFALSTAYAAVSFWAGRRLDTARARRLFLFSLIYLPALLAFMMIDKLPG